MTPRIADQPLFLQLVGAAGGAGAAHTQHGRKKFLRQIERVADDDGAVVVPKNLAVETAAKAQKRHDDEDGKRKRLAAGELSLDMYKMREGLAKAGLVYVDKPEDV